jgi:hypothetical protein
MKIDLLFTQCAAQRVSIQNEEERPKSDPWGTPHDIGRVEEAVLPMITV